MSNEPQQTLIEVEKNNFVYGNLGYGLIFHVLVAGGLVMGLYEVSPPHAVINWYVIFVVIASMRYALSRYYQLAKDVTTSYKTWRLLYIAGTVATGLAWGLGGVFLFPDGAVAQQLLHAFIIGGMVMGAVPFLAPLYPSFLLFNLTTEVPYVAFLFTSSDKLHLILALIHTLFAVSMLMAARSTEKNFLQNLMLRLINQDFAKQLNQTNRELEKKIELKDKIEQELRQNENRFKALSNASHEGVIIHKEGVIIDANMAMARMLGYTEQELIGMHTQQFIVPDSRDDIARCWKNPSDEPLEMESLRKDGTSFKTESRAGDIFYRGEKVRIVTVRDISRQKQIEADLLHAKQVAEEADRMKSEFIASVSHELRTPLNAIVGFMQVLELMGLSEEQEKYLRLGKKSADQLLLLINDLLDLSRIESGYFEYIPQDIDLKYTLQEVMQIMSGNAGEQNDHLHLQLADDLPAWIRVDPKRLRQVLINLLGNAIKFTEDGNVTLSASVEQTEGDRVVLRFGVRDEGIGIPEDKQQLIFRRFTQVDSSITRRYGGTGLGLAISQELVHKMGGEIGVQSKLGEGATFWFSLPCEVTAPPQALTPAKEEIAEAQAGKGMHVLVVEDEQTNRVIARALLEALGCRVSLAEDGQQAVEQDEAYDLIFMDMQMPVLDGLSATSRLREKGTTTPIIAMTANAERCDQECCLAAGMNDYLSKPIDRERLAELLGKWRQAPN